MFLSILVKVEIIFVTVSNRRPAGADTESELYAQNLTEPPQWYLNRKFRDRFSFGKRFHKNAMVTYFKIKLAERQKCVHLRTV